MTNPLGSSGVTAVLESGTAVIAASEALSAGVNLGGLRLFGLELPVMTSAALTFQVSTDGTTWRNLYDATQTEVTITASAGERVVVLDPALFAAVGRVKIRSGTAATPANQAAERTINLILRPV
jgi:hypothetical protein